MVQSPERLEVSLVGTNLSVTVSVMRSVLGATGLHKELAPIFAFAGSGGSISLSTWMTS